jgi:Ca-activated chloride channel family protein
MDFIWPTALAGLLVLPILGVLYILAQRRRGRYARRFGNPALLGDVVTASPGGRRHVAPTFYLLGAGLLIAALARPELVIPVPKDQATVVLAIDVSRSMEATDVQPTRIEAAKEAAKAFVEQLPTDARVGVVSFSGVASLVVAPTDDHTAVERGIDSLRSGDATAIGDGLLTALGTPPLRSGPPGGAGGRPGGRPGNPGGTGGTGGTGGAGGASPAPASGTSAPLFPPPDVVVLLSDGASNRGASTIDAANQAKDMGVKVYTVGVGTVGAVVQIQGRRTRVDLDETVLRNIAGITGGEYLNATNSEDLSAIYRDLGGKVGWEDQKTEVTFLVAGAALLASLAGGLISFLLLQRFP